MDYEKAFNDFYQHCENMIFYGNLHGDEFDRADSILSIIYKVEDSVSGIFYSMESDGEKDQFLADFKGAVRYLQGPFRSDKDIAAFVIAERSL